MTDAPATTKRKHVDLETARAARGLRLVTVEGIPSPWSEAAKGIFHVKEIPFVTVRLSPADRTVREWTRVRNAPAAMYENEPARTGWADILELGERLAPARSLVPADPAARVRMFGLAHEVMGEGGLLWSSRNLTIHLGLTTDGARGFPPMVAGYLGKRYGYDPGQLDRARARVAESWTLLAETLGDRPYYFGTTPTALDIYSAAAVNLFALPPEESCAMFPLIRTAFETMRGDVAEPPPALVEHRDRMYARHLELPIEV
jgi:glutathione S-transferase